MTTAVTTPRRQLDAIKSLVLNSLTSPRSRRAYSTALDRFLSWHGGRRPLNKAVVNEYKTILLDTGLSPATINLHLTAIRKLAFEARDNQLLDPESAAAIIRIPGAKSSGHKIGNWLTKRQTEKLLDLPDRATLRGLRDRALLCLAVSSALRRDELAGLTIGQIQQREGRWAIVDVKGKGNRTRTVPIPSWAKAAIDEWLSYPMSGITERLLRERWSSYVTTPLLLSIGKGDKINGSPLGQQSIYDIVRRYGARLGLNTTLAPHDLRRTAAKLAMKGGAPLDQIQLTLGHASLITTQLYLGTEQNLSDAPCDRLGLEIE